MALITRKYIAILTMTLGGAGLSGTPNALAQTFGLEYISEWQTDFNRGYDWLNFLKTSASISIGSHLNFEASTISTAKTGDSTLIPDLLTYSNIEAGNIPLTIARAGLDLAFGDAEIFLGINNVNENYFTSELTSYFTNSPCGISPTISCNYDIANYPLSAWCIHYGQRFGHIRAQTSLYPGKGYYRLGGAENLFRMDLRSDGVFSISSIEHERDGFNTFLGVALHYGVRLGDQEGWTEEAQAPEAKKRWSATPWVLSEIRLNPDLGLLLHGSLATVSRGCKAYAGAGLLYGARTVQPGIALNYADFSWAKEYSMEFAAKIPFTGFDGFLQPTIHLVKTGSDNVRCIGMVRLQINFGPDI